MSNVKECWLTIEHYLKRYTPNAYKTLGNPAEDYEIQQLIEALNLPLPKSLIESLQIHNGQNDDSRLNSFLDYQHLLSCSGIINTYEMMNSICPDEEIVDWIDPKSCEKIKRYYIWNKKWFHFTDSEGDGLIMDFDPAKFGKSGQIFFSAHDDNPPVETLAESYEDWLIKICTKLEQNEFTINRDMILLNEFTFM